MMAGSFAEPLLHMADVFSYPLPVPAEGDNTGMVWVVEPVLVLDGRVLDQVLLHGLHGSAAADSAQAGSSSGVKEGMIEMSRFGWEGRAGRWWERAVEK